MILDPADPFDQALIRMRELAGSKGHDYAAGSRWSNFDAQADFYGFEHNWLPACGVVVQKMWRLRSLIMRGKRRGGRVMTGFVCPVCGSIWVTHSLQHDCWRSGHIDTHYECVVCVKERGRDAPA